MWQTFNNLLHHKSSSLLATSTTRCSLAYSFEISKLHISLTSDTSSSTRSPPFTSKNSYSPIYSFQSVTIQSVCSKLSTIYSITNLLRHYLPLPRAFLSLTASKFPNFISLSAAILLLHPHVHPDPISSKKQYFSNLVSSL